MAASEEEEVNANFKLPNTKSRTPILDFIGRDITKLADEGRLDPVIGREFEIESIIQILSRRKRNNPILVGESGVGKTAIIDALAQSIIRKRVNRSFHNKRVVVFDIETLQSITDESGKKIIEIFQSIIKELQFDRSVILVLENINLFILNNKSIIVDAFSLLKAALTRGEIQCIGIINIENSRLFEKDTSYERIFQKVIIDPPSKEQTITILENVRLKYEEYHRVSYTEESIIACVELSERFLKNRFFPDKAIDILDQVGCIVRIKNIHVPKHIEELEKRIEDLKEEKNSAVKNQQYEKAADLRDMETKLVRQLEQEQIYWEEASESKRYPVTEDDVQELFENEFNFNKDKIHDENIEFETLQEEQININYLKDKIAEFDLENKASIKIQGIPNNLKTSFQQYILFFKDYLEKVKDKTIFFEVSKIEEGLRIDINPTEIGDFEEFNSWFNEYMDFIRQKKQDFKVIFEKDVDEKEGTKIMTEIKNQVEFLESQINIIQPQLKKLTEKSLMLDNFSLNISSEQKYLIELGYSDIDTYKYYLKQSLGDGNIKQVLEGLLKYTTKSLNSNQDISDEIILFNSRISDLEFKSRGGLLTFESEGIEKQKINKGVLELINKI